MPDVHPIVRYILCEEMIIVGKRVSLLNVILNMVPTEVSSYPVARAEICLFVVLTEVRGRGEFFLRIVEADSATMIFENMNRSHDFGNDPLRAHGLPFRIRNCKFPRAGLYWIQFWFNGSLLEQQDLFLKE